MPDISPSSHPRLFRAIRSSRWFDLRSMAFRLRPAETSLSAILLANCTKLVCDAGQRKCFGEFVLDTAAVTSRWEVRSDDPLDPTYSSNHANIFGLPLHGSDELAIEEAASDLSDLVTSVQHRPA